MNAAEEPHAQSEGRRSADLSTATGATGLVGLGQLLEEPWRTGFSLAGPYMAIVGRLLLAWMQPAYQLLEIQILILWTKWFIKEPAERDELIQEFEEAKKLVLQKFGREITRRPKSQG